MFLQRFISTITPRLRSSQLRQGEDLTKIQLVTYTDGEEFSNDDKNEELLPKYTSRAGSVEYFKDQTTYNPSS